MFLKAITRFLAPLLLVALVGGCSQPATPDVSFTTLDGQSSRLSALRGKVVLVNFWATTCTTCVAEMPMLVSTYNKYQGKGYRTVAVAMEYDPPAYVLNFVKTRQLPFEVALDNTGQVARDWGNITITPTTFLLNKRGEIVKQYVGAPDEKELHTLIEKLLAET